MDLTVSNKSSTLSCECQTSLFCVVEFFFVVKKHIETGNSSRQLQRKDVIVLNTTLYFFNTGSLKLKDSHES